MQISEYQRKAMETAIYPSGDFAGLAYAALGLNGEAGEFAEHVKKIARDSDATESREKLDSAITARLDSMVKELGDVLWYVAAVCREIGVPMEQIAEQNIIKLQSRMERNVIKGDGDNR